MYEFMKPGGWEQSDPKRIKESLSVPECCASCDNCTAICVSSVPGVSTNAPRCVHRCMSGRDIDIDPRCGRPVWCPLNTSFVKA